MAMRYYAKSPRYLIHVLGNADTVSDRRAIIEYAKYTKASMCLKLFGSLCRRNSRKLWIPCLHILAGMA